MKHIFTIILTALLLCGMLAPSTFATEEPTVSTDPIVEETDGTDSSALDPYGTESSAILDDFDYIGSIISYTTPDALTATFDMVCGDTAFTQLHSVLDSIIISGTVETDVTSHAISMSVTWDFSTVDARTPGNYTAIGSISIPEGAILSDGLENTIYISIQVTAPVLTLSPASITLTSFDEPYRTDAIAFPVGTTQEELSEWFTDVTMGFTGYDADGNYYNLISGTWSLDAINTLTPCVYYASVTPDLGTEYTLADGISLPQQLCAVSIQTLGEPDINCYVAGRGFLHFPWVLSEEQQEQLNEFAVWLRQDGGEWTSLSDGFLFVSDGLQLSQRIFTYGSTYNLKVTYPGSQTGILSFQYDGKLSILDYSSGDRDGGDVISNNLPVQTSITKKTSSKTSATPMSSTIPVHSDISLSQETQGASPEPENNEVLQPEDCTKTVINPLPKDNNIPSNKIKPQEDATVEESYSPTQTIISGLRLKDLCKDEESVVFGSSDLTVSIPSDLLLSLNLSDSDTLSIKLTQPESNKIRLAIEISGKLFTKLEGTVLRLRYIPQSENSKITVQNEAGEQITDASYDGEFLRFSADTTTTYTISELSNKQEAKKGISPIFPILVVLILATVGSVFFRRKLHG